MYPRTSVVMLAICCTNPRGAVGLRPKESGNHLKCCNKRGDCNKGSEHQQKRIQGKVGDPVEAVQTLKLESDLIRIAKITTSPRMRVAPRFFGASGLGGILEVRIQFPFQVSAHPSAGDTRLGDDAAHKFVFLSHVSQPESRLQRQ